VPVGELSTDTSQSGQSLLSRFFLAYKYKGREAKKMYENFGWQEVLITGLFYPVIFLVIGIASLFFKE
jgi:hypothetical protein